MSLKCLESIRLAELEKVLGEMRREKPNGGSILEIGAGTGWQAKQLSEKGYSVQAIDMNESDYTKHRIWPILNYDGKHIPFPDNHFDIVFSSNVLEHIPNVKIFQTEIKRVLKSNGIAIHVVPTATWRFWTIITHYIFYSNVAMRKLFGRMTPNDNKIDAITGSITARESWIKRIRRVISPSKHGEVGTAISEIYYFSRYRWNFLFESTGWKIEKYFRNNLFYAGSVNSLSIRLRKFLSFILGSSCHIYVLTQVYHDRRQKQEKTQ